MKLQIHNKCGVVSEKTYTKETKNISNDIVPTEIHPKNN